MSNVTTLPNRQQLTTAQRFLIAKIQDLCIDVTQQTVDVACFEYDGNMHAIYLRHIPEPHLSKQQGGNSSFKPCWSRTIYLPPQPPHNADEAANVGQAIDEAFDYLTGLVPKPGGAA